MNSDEKKEAIREYKKTVQPAGVWAVRCLSNGRVLMGTSANVPGMLNRVRFQLEGGLHPDRELQADWTSLGAGSFVFETIDLLPEQETPDGNPAADLAALKELWLEKFRASGTELYGVR